MPVLISLGEMPARTCKTREREAFTCIESAGDPLMTRHGLGSKGTPKGASPLRTQYE